PLSRTGTLGHEGAPRRSVPGLLHRRRHLRAGPDDSPAPERGDSVMRRAVQQSAAAVNMEHVDWSPAPAGKASAVDRAAVAHGKLDLVPASDDRVLQPEARGFVDYKDLLARVGVGVLFVLLSLNLLADFNKTHRMTGLLLLISEGM